MGFYEDIDEQKQFACRVIADHARTTAFAIADGILPGNEGRNYVLRKIMRRAIYHGREHLGFKGLFFNKVCDFVVGEMKSAYPELETQREFIGKMVRLEEERFGSTMTVGLMKLDQLIGSYIVKNREEAGRNLMEEVPTMTYDSPILKIHEIREERKFWQKYSNLEKYPAFNEKEFDESHDALEKFPSKWAYLIENPIKVRGLIKESAKLYDTFGTPKDLILVSFRNSGFEISEDDFDTLFDTAIQELQQTSEIGKTKQSGKINPIYIALERTSVKSNFHGYEKTKIESAKVIALVKNESHVKELNSGDEGLIILDETPFYAEAGGQVGDTGILVSSPSVSAGLSDATGKALPDGRATDTLANIRVLDTFAPIPGIILHKSKVQSGLIKVGDSVTATVDVAKRDATRRNHTATHLVHAALKEVLGTHVKQGGSVVAPTYLRFDYTHYQPLTAEEIREVEDLVNRYILQNEPVTTNVMAIEEAMRTGAVALFGEKYGSDVRVLSVGNGEFSKELCGGTHVRATGDIGSFKIISDESVASGLRRIRAITGIDSFERFREDEKLIDEALGHLKTQRDQLPNAIEKLQEELKKARKENDDLKMKIATGAIGTGTDEGDEPKEIKGITVVAKIVDGLDKSGMRHLSDTLLAKMKSGVVVLARTEEDKVSFIVRVSDDLTDRVKAGKIVQEIAPIVGGRGGGKPDMAEGGGTDASKLTEAIEASFGVIEKMLG